MMKILINYKIKSTTRCYFCGKTFIEHQQEKTLEQSRPSNISASSTEYEKTKKKIPEHVFSPAAFVAVTGEIF